MSAAQLLIVIVGLGASFSTFVLMRFPHHRREQYRGQPFSTAASLAAAAVVLAVCLAFALAQGVYESR
jgi:hypothetical protein